MPTVQDIMTTDLCTLQPSASIAEAAEMMRSRDVGDVLVVSDDQQIVGIVTDRDIAVRAVAEGRDPRSTAIEEICTEHPTTLQPDSDAGEAVRRMREAAVRRLPVVEDGRPVGVVSIGDLAVALDPGSALADISADPPNN